MPVETKKLLDKEIMGITVVRCAKVWLGKRGLSFICVWLLLSCGMSGVAQIKLTGTVKDAETGAPLDGTNVVVLRGGRAVSFSITNGEGTFSLPIELPADTLILYVSMLGYTPFLEKIGHRTLFEIELNPAPIQLNEVTIRPGRIWGRNDTIRYDASQFLRENDRTVEDLMKRLPGIQIDDDGNIQYKGKSIGTLYVEGLDLMDSRYKSISRNLPAQSVKEVEVLDNHQRVKSLVGKVASDVTDINLKLNDNFKDKWSFNTKEAVGFSVEDFLYEAEGNAMQISKKSQSLYALKLSNTGNGITKEADKGIEGTLQNLPDYRLLPTESISSPLKERRWLFNDAAIATANRLYRLTEDSRLKLNVFYTKDHINRESALETSYFNITDTLMVVENKNQTIKEKLVNISADYEVNASTHFLRNKMDFRLEKENVGTDISGTHDVFQSQRSRSVSLQDNFMITRTLHNNSVWQFRSVVGYWHRRQQLLFNSLDQPIALHGLYANSESRWIIRHTKIAQDYTAGASVDFNNLEKVHRLWFRPTYEHLINCFKFNLSLPFSAILLPEQSDVLFHPGFIFRTDYKINYAWTARFTAQYKKELEDIIALYRRPYYTDYRTFMVNDKGIPVTGKQYYTLRAEYKNTMSEFFVTADIHAANSKLNHTLEQTVEDDVFQWTRRYLPHRESSYGISSTLSKGFYDINTKTSLESSYWYNKSAQIRNGEILPFSLKMLTLKPNVSISPYSFLEVAYSGEFQFQSTLFGNNNQNDGLWSMNHKVSLYYIKKQFDLSSSVEYYHNEIAPARSVNLLFADFTATYKFSRLTLQLQLNNLLDHRNYRYTIYQPLSVYLSQTNIRPREVLLRIIMKI